MKTYKYFLTITVSSLVFSIAQAQMVGGITGQLLPSQPTTRLVNESTQTTGTIIKRDIKWDSKIPLNKTYGELTPEQKAELHALYNSMPEGDEPPFPAEGLKSIFNAVRNAQRLSQARGEINMVVTVGPDGKATKVESFGNESSVRMTEVTQQILLLTKYKPGICSGKPCTMQFRFTQKLRA
jgi:hypothetical protein